MSDSYDDYEAKIQLAEHAWEKRVVKTEHDRAVELGKAYERGWNAALAQQEPVAWASSLDFDDDDQEIIPAKDKGKLGTSNCDIPLYAVPKNLSPLTDNQILEILPDAQHGWTTATYGKWVARAVERLHGIRGKSTKINNEITQEAVECLCGICKLDKCEWVGLTTSGRCSPGQSEH